MVWAGGGQLLGPISSFHGFWCLELPVNEGLSLLYSDTGPSSSPVGLTLFRLE